MMVTRDIYDLQRFVDAQEPLYQRVLAELSAGSKRSHWMWFIFPQLKGLGMTSTSMHYGISGLAEAKAYLEHQVLGPRLRECTERVNAIEGKSVSEIFGYPDDLKFRSSMTLFSKATDENQLFVRALDKYFEGQPDQRTLAMV